MDLEQLASTKLTGADGHLLELEERERRRTGLAQLKVGYNRVQGYYIELPRSQSERAPLDYQRRHTVKNAERFITPELKQFEDKVLGADERIVDAAQRPPLMGDGRRPLVNTFVRHRRTRPRVRSFRRRSW